MIMAVWLFLGGLAVCAALGWHCYQCQLGCLPARRRLFPWIGMWLSGGLLAFTSGLVVRELFGFGANLVWNSTLGLVWGILGTGGLPHGWRRR